MFILHTMTFYTLYNFVLGIISNKVYNGQCFDNVVFLLPNISVGISPMNRASAGASWSLYRTVVGLF